MNFNIPKLPTQIYKVGYSQIKYKGFASASEDTALRRYTNLIIIIIIIITSRPSPGDNVVD